MIINMSTTTTLVFL